MRPSSAPYPSSGMAEGTGLGARRPSSDWALALLAICVTNELFPLSSFLLRTAVAMVPQAPHRTSALVTDTRAPGRARHGPGPWQNRKPPPHQALLCGFAPGVATVCAVCRKREGWWVNLKFNLFSFSHREKEWEQASKNSLACQNC